MVPGKQPYQGEILEPEMCHPPRIATPLTHRVETIMIMLNGVSII